jgi:PAS domain S-box-containing protein
MHRPRPVPTGVERTFAEHEIIVSKTDLTGKITYANDVFLRVSGYGEHELLGQPHSIIRHPDMPRAIFKLLWDTIGSRQEIFAFVNNLASNGDHYWVLAHVTPSVGPSGAVVGYHSNRRVPDRDAVETVAALYDELLREERRHADRQRGLQASMVMLRDVLAQRRLRYDEFVFSLISHEVAA